MKAIDKSISAIKQLLEMYEIDTTDPDVQQNIANSVVCIDNYYHGFDDDGNKVKYEDL